MHVVDLFFFVWRLPRTYTYLAYYRQLRIYWKNLNLLEQLASIGFRIELRNAHGLDPVYHGWSAAGVRSDHRYELGNNAYRGVFLEVEVFVENGPITLEQVSIFAPVVQHFN